MVKDLSNTTHKVIVDCLHTAFADYSIPMKASYDYWQSRWHAARIDHNLSFGFFDGNSLVGFVLHGIDDYDGKYSFFNMGTGVIPAYRNQRIVKQIYDHAMPLLKKANVHQGVLEVITTNEKAIRAYKSVGFTINRTLHSFNAKNPGPAYTGNVILKKHFNLSDYRHLQSHHLSWENNNKTIIKDPAQFITLELHQDDKINAYAMIKKSNKNVTQFGVENAQWNTFGPPLFSAIETHYPGYRIINIDSESRALLDYLDDAGFPKLLDQYEMQLNL